MEKKISTCEEKEKKSTFKRIRKLIRSCKIGYEKQKN